MPGLSTFPRVSLTEEEQIKHSTVKMFSAQATEQQLRPPARDLPPVKELKELPSVRI